MEMPPATFGPKWPFLNHRYHNRRNAYLAHVAALLGDSRVNKGLIKYVVSKGVDYPRFVCRDRWDSPAFHRHTTQTIQTPPKPQT